MTPTQKAACERLGLEILLAKAAEHVANQKERDRPQLEAIMEAMREAEKDGLL